MGFGILTYIKSFAPGILYFMAIFLVFLGFTDQRKYSLWFLITILPLRNVIDKLHAYPLGKDIDEAFILSLLLGLIFKSLSKEKLGPSKSPITPLAVILIFLTFFSLIQGSLYLHEYNLIDLSSPRVQTWKNFCIPPVIFILTLHIIRTKKDVWRTILVICGVVFFMNYYLVQQLSWFSSIESRSKVHGTFNFLGPNEIAAFYNQLTLILVSIFFSLRKKMFKILLLALIGVNLFCILFLFSRAAYAGLAVGLFVLFSIRRPLLLVPLVLVVIYWQIALPQKVQERILMTTNEYGQLDKSSELRLVLWEQSLELFKEYPITGIGFAVFRQLGYVLGDTHNIYIKILIEQGIVGLSIFLLLLLTFFAQGYRLFLSGDDELSKGLGIGFAVSILVVLVNNFFGDRWTYPEVSAYIWVSAGLVARLLCLSSSPPQTLRSSPKKGLVQKLDQKYGQT